MQTVETPPPTVNVGEIERLLAIAAGPPDPVRSEEILARARSMKGLPLEDVAWLLVHRDPELTAALTSLAIEVKHAIYGRRIVLFAPLYTSSYCVNSCAYCGFQTAAGLAGSSDDQPAACRSIDAVHAAPCPPDVPARRRLSLEEIRRETEVIIGMGHKRILMVAAEDPKLSARDLADQVQAIYSVKTSKGEIRRVNLNVAPMSTEDFRIVKSAGIGTYQCFQETFHPETYAKMHRRGPKADFAWRLGVFARAIPAGVDDFGMGILFGLYDHRFEVLAMLQQIADLERRFGIGPHTISIPRLEPAFGTSLPTDSPWLVSDDDLIRITAILRLAVPYTGIILSTRESAALRTRLLEVGVSQMSAGSITDPGGYSEREHAVAQFATQDHRSLDEVVRDAIERGYVPSFCTGCYRKARTGKVFQSLARTEQIGHFCDVNAIATLAEFLLDCASPETRARGERRLAELVAAIDDPAKRREVEIRLAALRDGQRDLIY